MIDRMIIYPGKLSGEVDLRREVPNKSMLIRAVLLCALSGGDLGAYTPLCVCDDARAALDCARRMRAGESHFAVGESASLLRFLIPIALTRGGGEFELTGTLMRRSLKSYEEALPSATFELSGNKLTVCGSLKGLKPIARDISSQFVSGLLMALPFSGCDTLKTTGDLNGSTGYIAMTMRIMERFGIKCECRDGEYRIFSNVYTACDFADEIEGDWSFGAYLYAANSHGCRINMQNMPSDGISMQPDACVTKLTDCDEINIDPCPDLFPPLCVAAVNRAKPTRFIGCDRLRYKESDRLEAMRRLLLDLGASVELSDGVCCVSGCVRGGEVTSVYGDHRIAMAAAMLSVAAHEPIIVGGALGAVKKSVPDFFEIFARLGGYYEYLG